MFGWILVFFMYSDLRHLNLQYNTLILFKRDKDITQEASQAAKYLNMNFVSVDCKYWRQKKICSYYNLYDLWLYHSYGMDGMTGQNLKLELLHYAHNFKYASKEQLKLYQNDLQKPASFRIYSSDAGALEQELYSAFFNETHNIQFNPYRYVFGIKQNHHKEQDYVQVYKDDKAFTIYYNTTNQLVRIIQYYDYDDTNIDKWIFYSSKLFSKNISEVQYSHLFNHKQKNISISLCFNKNNKCIFNGTSKGNLNTEYEKFIAQILLSNEFFQIDENNVPFLSKYRTNFAKQTQKQSFQVVHKPLWIILIRYGITYGTIIVVSYQLHENSIKASYRERFKFGRVIQRLNSRHECMSGPQFTLLSPIINTKL